MGLRETLNRYPAISAAFVAALLVGGGAYLFLTLRGGDDAAPLVGTEIYFTTDDSSPQAAQAALYPAGVDALSPTEHNGKPAYRARVYSMDGGKTKVVQRLERYTPAFKKKLEDFRKQPNAATANQLPLLEEAQLGGLEVKAPGPGKWQSANTAEGAKLLSITADPASQEVNP